MAPPTLDRKVLSNAIHPRGVVNDKYLLHRSFQCVVNSVIETDHLTFLFPSSPHHNDLRHLRNKQVLTMTTVDLTVSPLVETQEPVEDTSDDRFEDLFNDSTSESEDDDVNYVPPVNVNDLPLTYWNQEWDPPVLSPYPPLSDSSSDSSLESETEEEFVEDNESPSSPLTDPRLEPKSWWFESSWGNQDLPQLPFPPPPGPQAFFPTLESPTMDDTPDFPTPPPPSTEDDQPRPRPPKRKLFGDGEETETDVPSKKKNKQDLDDVPLCSLQSPRLYSRFILRIKYVDEVERDFHY